MAVTTGGTLALELAAICRGDDWRDVGVTTAGILGLELAVMG